MLNYKINTKPLILSLFCIYCFILEKGKILLINLKGPFTIFIFFFLEKAYLESYRGSSSEHRLRKQATEAKEGPLGLRSKKGKHKASEERRGEWERYCVLMR